jgi:c-di-GMP-binding flagellar brake protein YcgR
MLAFSNNAKKSLEKHARVATNTGGSMFWPLRRRRDARHQIPLEGFVRKGEKSIPCRLRNISAGGALIEIDSNDLFELNAHLRIGHTATLEIPSIGAFKAHPTRMHWKFAGFAFEAGSAEIGAFIKHWQEAAAEELRPH